MNRYIVACSKEWFRKTPKPSEFDALDIVYIDSEAQLNRDLLTKVNPRYIFFVHWNWIVGSEIFENFDCIVFHTSPLPFGRGGSPIQNLILRGFKSAPVCAIRMSEKLDSGAVYLKHEISLAGSLREIFERMAITIANQIVWICNNEISPTEQTGKSNLFKRLKNADNELKGHYSKELQYDLIRMVDGIGYDHAYIKFGDYRIELSNAAFENKELVANVRFIKVPEPQIEIRRAAISDSDDILNWRNDPVSRSMFRSANLVNRSEHELWYTKGLSDPFKVFFIGLVQENSIGVCRFDINDGYDTAEVSINLNPSYRGMGLSKLFLNECIKEFSNRFKYISIVATVMLRNDASIKLFEGCNFIRVNVDEEYIFYKLN